MGPNDLCADRDVIQIPMGFWNMPTETEWTAAASVAKAEQDAKREAEIELIRRQMIWLANRERVANAGYEGEIQSIKAEKKKMRSLCPHPKTTYVPDASGNSDWEETCDLCGADMREVARAENTRRWKEQNAR